MQFIPAVDVISELERKASDCEKAAKEMPEPEATRLRKFAQLCHAWIMSLKYGNWTS